MIKVLIADDSALTRLVLRDLLSQDPAITVVAEVENGRQALEATARLRPDLIIMDILMPDMDGLEATIEIMAACPTPILVLSGNVDPKDSRNAFTAIGHGALDVMEKPQGLVTAAFAEIAERLIDKVKVLARVRVMHHFRPRRSASPTPAPRPPVEGGRRILAIGASTGGPRAMLNILKALPADLDLRILIVQHIARGFAEGFASWLNSESALAVRVARSGERLQPGVALVAPSDVHLQVGSQGRIVLSQAPPVNSCRPSVDVLFQSLASSDLAPEVVAVLLTGMGRDGAEGMAALSRHGGYNIAQDQSSCAVFGMPAAALSLGVVHQTLPLAEIAPTLLKLFRTGC